MVKEKAMTKLKEVKAKSEDSGSKAKQYLDGLLKLTQALTLIELKGFNELPDGLEIVITSFTPSKSKAPFL